ncbi:hypothetical protein RU86_GL001944 [Lactococcus piscium]|uniref:DUF4176 domain-containing protein n=1 Tax=Pseudolactococcus piscium TaxID=1364 RepID=A0A2A5RST4_9LACT|nr:DUF4176 domain-containing protein [Lactococcus piscium]PCS03021.1 hypothetical protein RU86_GL001944 [Lactococcus piscium]
MSEAINLLPLGTAISKKESDNVYIIISRGFQKQEDGTVLASYGGIIHPFGKTVTHAPIQIAENEITELHFLGYEDELDVSFIKQQLSKASEPSQKIGDQITISTLKSTLVSQTITDDTVELDHPQDPFYKFRNRQN